MSRGFCEILDGFRSFLKEAQENLAEMIIRTQSEDRVRIRIRYSAMVKITSPFLLMMVLLLTTATALSP